VDTEWEAKATDRNLEHVALW